jgi:hypothetical protein
VCKQKAKLEELSVWRVVNKLPAFLKTKPWPGGKAHKSLKLCKLRGRKMACKQSKEASDVIMLLLHTTAKDMACPRKQTGWMDPSAKCLLFLFSVATTTTTRSDFDHKTTKSQGQILHDEHS